MRLELARLCLNCEEVHDSQACPVCTSESFAYIKRWIPALEPRPQRRPPRLVRASWKQRVVFGSSLGVIAFALGRWSHRVQDRVDRLAFRSGELR